MPTPPPSYYGNVNQRLLAQVPASARAVLDVGCGEGALGRALKQREPACRVYGAEFQAGPAAVAAQHLDQAWCLDIERGSIPLAEGSLDCILYGDVLEHLQGPEAVLRRHRRLLAPGGQVLCSVPNVQHHSVLAALLTSDFLYEPSGLLDATHLRFFTYSSFTKLLLDAGYVPALIDTTAVSAPPAFHQATGGLVNYLGLGSARTRGYLDAYQFLFRGEPVAYLGEGARPASEPLTFVACVNDEASLRANLLRSPDLGPGSPHEVLLFRNCASAAEGLNRGRDQARHRLVVGLHQDVYLPAGWASRFVEAVRQAETTFGPLGVIGTYGVRRQGDQAEKVGLVVDRDRLLREPAPLPARVETLDELLLALPKDSPVRFDPFLGFHFYGADVGLQAAEAGRAVVVVEALCFHHSKGEGLPPAFQVSAELFATKWAHRLPVATSCAWVKPRTPAASSPSALPDTAFFPPARTSPASPDTSAPPANVLPAQAQPAVDAFHRLYYASLGWDQNRFLGFPIKQCPFDLQAYQEVVFRTRPQLILQTGVAGGGSLLYFATLLDLLGAPPDVLVIGIDLRLSPEARRLQHSRIKLLEGSSTAPVVLRALEDQTRGRRGLVSLDSDHRAEHVLAELRAYQKYVAAGNYLVAEDTNINGHPVVPDFGPGPREAVEDFLREASSVFQRDDNVWRRHLFSFHQHGWLRRKDEAVPATAKGAS